MEIETDRLRLRTIRPEDAEDIFRYSGEPNVGPNAGWKPHETIEETREIMELLFTDKEGVFGIVEKESGRMIGSVGLVEDPKRENPAARMLGYALSESCWGRGYMTEAVRAVLFYGFYKLHLSIISAYCYPDNERSRKVLAKSGFTYEGTLACCELRYDGVVLDNECFSLGTDEFA